MSIAVNALEKQRAVELSTVEDLLEDLAPADRAVMKARSELVRLEAAADKVRGRIAEHRANVKDISDAITALGKQVEV